MRQYVKPAQLPATAATHIALDKFNNTGLLKSDKLIPPLGTESKRLRLKVSTPTTAPAPTYQLGEVMDLRSAHALAIRNGTRPTTAANTVINATRVTAGRTKAMSKTNRL